MSTFEQSQQADRSTLLIGATELSDCVDMPRVIDAIEGAFAAYKRGEAQMPSKTYVDLQEYDGDFRAMPALVEDAAGVKWVNVHPNNPEEFDLPTVMGLVIYNDPETAYPLAVMDGTKLTRYRTGAVAGVASRYLAPPDATSLGLLGAGKQAHSQLAAIASVAGLDRVVVADVDEDAIERFIEQERNRDVAFTAGDPEDVARCDVVSTTTPARSPIIELDWIEEGTHINAIGADAEGKRELDPAILDDAAVVIDDWDQCAHSGEINVPVASGRFDREDVHADLSAVVTGDAPAPDGEITVFDSTGLAIQDVATARLVYEMANEKGLGTDIQLVGT